jgi:outer membrane protein assembly factor BamB
LTGESTVTEGSDRTRQIAIILLSLAAATVVLFFIAGKRPPGLNGEDEPFLQMSPVEAQGDSAEADSAVSAPGARPPDLWTQPRGVPGGNSAWGASVIAPFDTLWHIDTGYEFFSAPALCDGRIYLGCNDGRFRCIGLSSGSILWSYSVTCGLCGEAAVDSQRVYFGGQDGYVYALDRTAGTRLWSAGLGYHVFADVAILADTLVVTGNSMGQVAALRTDDGTVVWHDEPGGLVLGPCVIDTLAVFTSEDGVVAVYDAEGDLLWKRDFPAQASAPSASPGSVYAGFSDGMVRRMDLHSGETLWETDLTPSPVRNVISRPVLAGSTVLVGTCDSRLVALDAGNGAVKWETGFENWIQVPPVVADSVVYVPCDDKRLHLVDLATGEVLHSLEIGGYSGTAPLYLDGTLVYGTAAGDLFAVLGTGREEPEPEPGTGEETPGGETSG